DEREEVSHASCAESVDLAQTIRLLGVALQKFCGAFSKATNSLLCNFSPINQNLKKQIQKKKGKIEWKVVLLKKMQR
ncbi:MAG: hypothetical protein J6S23_00135, partial [Clostridia bacterium]|nr:hypothetical protein [Clostridia bacterium]